MCRGWFKKQEVNPEWDNNTISLMGIGDYLGSANDLAGPPYDVDDFKSILSKRFPNVIARKFKDSKVTDTLLLSEIQHAVDGVKEGGLFVTIMDNCFSESNTKNIHSPKILGQRVYVPADIPRRRIVRSRAFKNAGNYIAMSACLDHETAADAYFEHPNGAYTYCLLKTLEPGITYLQWHERTKKMLHDLGFEQTCTIEGPIELQNRKVFEGNIETIYLSSHGSYTHDASGDESDGQDEGPYVINGLVNDDRVNAVIATNPLLV
jgi:hypothetical protein